MNFNELNAHPRDHRLTFDETSHTYTLDGNAVLYSVTTLVEDCFEQFDAAYWAARKATPTVTAQMLIEQWEAKGRAARNAGTLMHARIEDYFLGRRPDAATEASHEYRLFLDFQHARRLTPYRTEWRIFYEEAAIAGTLDFLAVTPDGTLEIWDWKRSSKIVDHAGHPIIANAYGKTALAPIAHVPDTTFHHYALQVSLYRFILEEHYDLHVAGAHLGVFHPDYTAPHVVDLPYMRDEVTAIIAARRRRL